MEGSEDLPRAFRETAIVCGAMVASVLVYAVAVEVLRPRLPRGGVGASLNVDPLRYGFYVLAGIEGLAIPFLRGAVEAGPAVRANVLARLRMGALVAAALAEVPAVLGLVLFLLAGSPLDFYALAGWSLLLQLFHFPRFDRWEEAVRTAARHSG